jgi:hypothetical protein
MINKYSLFKEMDIKRYLLIDDDSFKKPESDELVIHIRIGDYKYNNSVIENRYYLNAIEMEKNNINKVTILTDSPNDSQLDEFRSIGCEIRCNSEIEDFAYIKNDVLIYDNTHENNINVIESLKFEKYVLGIFIFKKVIKLN